MATVRSNVGDKVMRKIIKSEVKLKWHEKMKQIMVVMSHFIAKPHNISINVNMAFTKEGIIQNETNNRK